MEFRWLNTTYNINNHPKLDQNWNLIMEPWHTPEQENTNKSFAPNNDTPPDTKCCKKKQIKLSIRLKLQQPFGHSQEPSTYQLA